MNDKRITIVGGGLAGLTLGIALRQRGVPVTLHEAGRYPRHRVCGEFISGRGQGTLRRLGLNELLDRAGAIRAETAAFFCGTKTSQPRPLPSRAICLSRYEMDRALADEFVKLGGELRQGERRQTTADEGTICATGRRLEGGRERARWFGLKIHARHVPMVADLEMHVSRHGYVGLCRVNGGLVNVCGLFRRQPIASGNGKGSGNGNRDARELLRGDPDSVLNARLAAAGFDESSFCAAAGFSLQPQRAVAREGVCIGDAITMTPPMTGNGMSMAFESAELVVEPLTAWSRGDLSWKTAQEISSHRCDEAFRRRLVWAKWLQKLAIMPHVQEALLVLYSRSRLCRRSVFGQTR